MADPSTGKTFVVALTVALLCSLMVSLTAVGLADRQQENRDVDLMKNVLVAAGMYEPGVDVAAAFGEIELKIVDLETGEYVTKEEIAGPGTYRQGDALSDPNLSDAVPMEDDLAGLGRREKYSYVGLIMDGDEIDQILFPVRGKGLFSMMFAFVALDGDLTTIRGLTFYQHGETAGLGGEITNPRWLEKWQGKLIYDDAGAVEVKVIKGAVMPGATAAEYKVDGLSGATMTSDGVTRLMQYWFGESGFKPYLDRLRGEGGDRG